MLSSSINYFDKTSLGISFGIILILFQLPNTYADDVYEKQVDFATSIQEILAYLEAAQVNYDYGNLQVTRFHMGFLLTEIYPKISNELSIYPQYDYKLNLILHMLKNVNLEMSNEAFIKEIDFVKKIIQEGENLVIPKELQNDPNFKMDIVNNLMERIVIKISESSTLDGIYILLSYQQCEFILNQAELILNTIIPN